MSRTKQQIRFCTAPDGVRISHATSGRGAPLVRTAHWLTHLELDWNSPVWSHWFEEFSQKRKLVRYDLRGCGLSDRSVDNQSIDAWVHDLEAVVDDLGLEQFPLLGICQGGAIAVAYAARHPSRVSRLILFGSYARGDLADGASPEEQDKVKVLEEMISVGWGQRNAAFRQVFVNLLMPEASAEQQRWLAELQRRTVSAETAIRLWRAFHAIDIRSEAPQVEAPTLVFHVENDAMVPFEEGRQIASLIPDARFVPLSGENHILRPEEPAWERFVSTLWEFLAEEDDQSRVPEEEFHELTPREREVLDLMARGTSNAGIAERLFISPKTVRNHITRIFSKLQVNRRAEAIVQAREAGFGHNGVPHQ